MHWIQEAKTQWHVWKRWILIGAGLLAFFFLLRLFPTEYFSKHVAALCEWVASKGAWAPFILGLIDAVGVAICFPLTLAFELAAGFLFGVTAGTIVISVAKAIGAAAALLLGRTLLNNWVQNTLKNNPHFSEVYSVMGKDTFRLAVMLRLSPVPSWINNYGLALTPISFQDFFLATILAGFPGVLRNVYLGSMMKSLSAPSSEDVSIWIHLVMGGLTIVASVLVTRYLYKYFKMAVGSEPTSGTTEKPEDDLESQMEAETAIPTLNGAEMTEKALTPPPETSGFPPSPLPPRQRIVIQ